MHGNATYGKTTLRRVKTPIVGHLLMSHDIATQIENNVNFSSAEVGRCLTIEVLV